MTITQAIRESRSEVSRLFPLGGQYAFEHYDASFKAWRQSIPTDYFNARYQRGRELARRTARKVAGEEIANWIEATYTPFREDWVAYVRHRIATALIK